MRIVQFVSEILRAFAENLRIRTDRDFSVDDATARRTFDQILRDQRIAAQGAVQRTHRVQRGPRQRLEGLQPTLKRAKVQMMVTRVIPIHLIVVAFADLTRRSTHYRRQRLVQKPILKEYPVIMDNSLIIVY